ncbi:hypothetical protein SAMN04515618_12359 [Collimonas sp. OK307]|uniref:hypothetical protein n=1 Tax=Collimonas sp. OK307 TaxID=1801620 RepID=UPI0008E78785|nr:hypothetical protein [Collimonas sp. OK307]SFI43163.1 hypothetical protein SAMN04515618_12359 [Collimonas sp. OK307]
MRASWKILAAALCATMTTTAVNAAEIAFSSPGDFTEIGLNIKNTYSANPDVITLEVTLSQDAQQRMAAASGAALGQDLTLIINGKAVSTSRVQSVLDTPQLEISMSRQTATELLPALLGVTPGANSSAASQAEPVVATAPVATAASAAPAGNQLAALAAAPVAVETRQVTPPSVAASVVETPIMPAPVAQEPAPEPVSTPAPQAETELAAMLATDTVPLVATAETAIASTDVAPPAPPAPAVAPAPPPVVPGWAMGAWLPTSATPSPYAEINAGDPVTIFANAADAIACNKARFSVLESRNTRVRLQLAPNSQCVISGVQIDRLQISSTQMPGRIAISLYALQDEFDGAPSKEGIYRRK